ncbi:MAG TPA: hypothetical protein VK255_01615 [Patescibacteria group bacterium]|nr:hypothetical protein [Patescibacteria group bacterium]
MFYLIKTIIWIAGTLVVAYFILGYFGYEPNMNYLNENKAKCEERLKECGQNLVKEGTNNAQCDVKCVEPKLIIKKK